MQVSDSSPVSSDRREQLTFAPMGNHKERVVQVTARNLASTTEWTGAEQKRVTSLVRRATSPATWSDASPDDAAVAVTGVAQGAVSTKTSRVRPDYYDSTERKVATQEKGVAIRTHFALRYGNIAASGDASEVREDAVREAFKSPFYPFVLVSTSVGQEGLDFHPWCHSVWHLNLPGNPVDLEQREGRVHRYKGHLVRKNVAHEHGRDLHAAWQQTPGDPWKILFELAHAKRAPDASNLVPGWLAPGPHKVERCIPLLPFSQEEQRLDRLKRSLAIYRVVFGQPRQKELLRLLSLGQTTAEDLEKWVISLEPPAKGIFDTPAD